MLPLVSPWNYVRAMCAEIPYWWCVTTQIWVVLMISHATSLWLTIRKTTQFLVVIPHQYWISALISQTSFWGKNQWWHHKMLAVFSGSSSWCFPRTLSYPETLAFLCGQGGMGDWEWGLIFKSSFKKQRTFLCFIWFCLFDRRVNYSEHWRKWDCHKNKLHADENWNPPLSYSWSPFKQQKKLLPNEVATSRNDFWIWKSVFMQVFLFFFFQESPYLVRLASLRTSTVWILHFFSFSS